MRCVLFCIVTMATCGTPAHAEDLFKGGNWASLAADRRASQIGDVVTIQVIENNSAANSVSQGSRKSTSLGGSLSTFKGSGSSDWDRGVGIETSGQYDGSGTSARTSRMAAQIGATVTEVLPNGDLMISGWQALNISGERTNIKVIGRVRRDDITAGNTILSSRLADARIEYDGKGFASRSAKPGIIARIFGVLGLL